jgi:prefoldin subunit 2
MSPLSPLLSARVGLLVLIVRQRRLVLETLAPLPEDRKCFRMINGVLVERTVKDVIPILQTNSEGLNKVLEELVVQYKSKQDEMEKWKVGHYLFFFGLCST